MKPNLVAALSLLLLAPVAQCYATVASFDVASGRPMVQLMVNGKGPYPFVLDTGSPSLLVMQSLADELGLPVVGSDELTSPVQGTPLPVDVVGVESIALGDATVRGLEAMVLDMEGHGLGRGVVGPALFREYGATRLDFDKNTMSMGEELSAEIESWLPFGPSAPLLDMPVRIGDVVIEGHLDTGSPGLLSVPNDLEERLPLSGPVRTIGRGRTVDAEFEIRSAPIAGSAWIGDTEIPLGEVILSAIPVANLGTAGLRGLSLTVDWENERFALTGKAAPAAGPRHAPQQQGASPAHRVVQGASGDGPRFGLRAMPSPDGAIQVAGTDPGSPAEAMGLQPGDRIIALNGKSPADLDFAGVRAELAKSDLVLTVERGGEEMRLQREVAPIGSSEDRRE